MAGIRREVKGKKAQQPKKGQQPDKPFDYEDWVNWQATWRDLRLQGKVVFKKEEAFWEQCRQALHGYYLNPGNWDKVASPGWFVFIQELRTHSGKHRHQGGICLFVLEGRGYTVVDGVRYDWEAGDCILMPLKHGGIEHQHFNENPDGPSRWMCFDYIPLHHLMGGTETEQKELHPDWRGKQEVLR